jgi:tetratricopeptide (TPR) repeat protein
LDRYEVFHGADERLALERLLLRVERGDPDSAVRLCEEMLAAQNPDAPLLLEAMVRGFMRVYRLGETNFWARKWLRLQPDHPQALCLYGELCQFADQYQEALVNYRRALELDPEHDESRLQLAMLLVTMRKATDAKAELAILLRRRPDDPMMPLLLARSHDQLGEREQAEAVLDESLGRWPDHAQSLAERGRLAREDGQGELAEGLLRRALAQAPGDYGVRFQLQMCLRQNGKAEEAQKLQNRVREAEEDMRRLAQIILHDMQERPHDAALHFEVASIRFREGAIDESLRWLHSTLQLDPHHAGAHRALAGYYRKTGRLDLAAKHDALAGPEPAAGAAPAAPPRP